jgi:hypothetical protein
MAAPTTLTNSVGVTISAGATVAISWTAPDTQGEVTSYAISIKKKDGDFAQSGECPDGLELTCTVNVATLRSTTFLLVGEDVVVAKVTATNGKGEEATSPEGGIALIPNDAPTGCKENGVR